MNGEILLYLQSQRTPFVNDIMLFVTNLVWVMVGLCAAGLFFKKSRKICAQILVSVAAAFLLADLIKQVVREPRPFVTVAGLVKVGPTPGGTSFPSAHTAVAFSLFWTLLLDRNRWKWWGLAFACLVGFSRMYLGVHYPTDVLGGIVTSLAACWGVHCLFRWRKGCAHAQ